MSEWHEKAHYLIDRGYFSTKDIETYKQLFESDLKRGKRYFETEYEMTDWEEDFCTNFYYAMTKKKSKIYLKKRIKFIQSIIDK